MGRACNTNGGEEEFVVFLLGKSEGKTPLGTPRRRWEDNIVMDLREIGWGGTDWINLAQDKDQWRACEHSDEPSGSTSLSS
jgi:hypothetical protein